MDKVRNFLVLAKAGSGKTATMTKIVEATAQKGGDLKKLLVVTFTKAGVQEFYDRISKALEKHGISCDGMITTFHGLALEICQKFYKEVGFTDIPKEVNPVDKALIAGNLVKGKKIPGPEDLYKKDYNDVLNVINVAIEIFDKIGENEDLLKSDNMIHDIRVSLKCKDEITDATVQEITDLYPAYVKELRKNNIILFSDMERMMHQILEAHPNYLTEEYGFEYIILDEAQDSSDIQMKTMRLLAKLPTKKYLFAVGDDNQSIYLFRNANVSNILNFEERLGQPVKTLEMLVNWRSDPKILELADAVVELNQNKTDGKTVAGREPNGKEPVVRGFHTDEDEYNFIASQVQRNYEKGTPLSRQAIICFSNKELMKIIEKLAAKGIPYVLKNPMEYSENSRVKAAIALIDNIYLQTEGTNTGFFAYLSALYNGEMLHLYNEEEVLSQVEEMQEKFKNFESMSFEAQRNILHEHLDAIRGNDEIYESFLDEYMYKYSDIAEEFKFIQAFKKYGKKMAKRMLQNYEGIVLTTAHSSKGLEWDIVYNSVSGYDSQLLHKNKYHNELEERRRLLYVSMTRAREELYVTGRYIVDGTKSLSAKAGGPCFNQFIKDLYSIKNMPYDPIDHAAEALRRAKAKEAYERKKEKLKAEYILSNTKAKAGRQVPKGTYLGTQTSIYDFIPQDDPNMKFKPKPEDIFA